METFKLVIAIVGIIATVYLLIKKYETRTVLIAIGLGMALLTLQPMAALDAFAKSMTSGGLIMAICSSMGFAYVMKYTECDSHLVQLLTKPLAGLKFFLIPFATIITFFINIAIPSAAGCAAAVGATLIPVLKSAGVRPATAGAAILAGTFGSMMSPGSSHSAMISEMSGLTITEVNLSHAPYTMIAGAIGAVTLTIIALILKDYGKEHRDVYLAEATHTHTTETKPTFICDCSINSTGYFGDWRNLFTTNLLVELDENGCISSNVNWCYLRLNRYSHITG